ncbi:MAG TPA: PIN domain-containing protein [Candidatus Sulfotelmatobacter sp.]|jgi:predicted nucleic acid-binding protein
MSSRDFLDTNILLCAYSPVDSRKQKIADELVTRAVLGELVISAQVLAEFASVLLHKVSPTKTPDEVKRIVDVLGPISVVVPDGDMVRRAVEAHAAYGIHFYDGMIVAAAERAGCEKIWSEDFNPGQEYFGVTVADPFS